MVKRITEGVNDVARKPKGEVRLKPTEQVRDRSKAVGFGGVSATYDAPTPYGVDTIRQLIFSTVWAETCINTIVDEVVKYPLFTSPTDDKIEAFLQYPSAKDPLFMIRKKYLKDMLRWGNGACVVAMKGSKPNGLVVVPGYTLRVTDKEPQTYVFLKIGSSSEFKTDESGEIIELTDKEVLHFCIDQDSDSTLGQSPLNRAYLDLTADKESTQKLTDFLKKGFYKPFFLSFEKGSQINRKDLESFVEYTNGLVEEGAKAMGINKKADFKDIPYLTAAEIIELQRWIGLKIASVFKVPPFMLNLVQDVGSLNAREQKARFLENVVMPILEYEAHLYTLVIAHKGFKNEDTVITSHVLGTKLNYDRARIARLLAGATMEILTQDEIRAFFFNLGPIGKGKTKDKQMD